MNESDYKYLEDICSSVLSMEEYCFKINGGNKYHDYLKTEYRRLSGMVKWPDDDAPEKWGNVFPGNYVAFYIYDYSDEKLRTPIEIHKKKLEIAERCIYYYNENVFKRLGWSKHSSDLLTDSELILVYSELTEEERMSSDIMKAQFISSDMDNPYKQVSTYNPYEFRLFGTDDCSYTLFFNEKRIHSVGHFILNPAWCSMEDFVFTN